MKPEINVFSGRTVDLVNPTVEMICLKDIAHALSQINRFTGHTIKPYSVAVHSFVGSYLVPQQYALEFLLHDATEAYVGDVSGPLKELIRPLYAPIEARFAALIAKKFGLSADAEADVNAVDEAMQNYEFRTQVPFCFDLTASRVHVKPGTAVEVDGNFFRTTAMKTPAEVSKIFIERARRLMADRWMSHVERVG